MKRARPAEQLELTAKTWGGAREGAGRKPSKRKGFVSHSRRSTANRLHPLHITLRVRDGVPNLRRRVAWQTIVRAMRAGRGRFGLHVVEYAVLGNHLHLMVEIERPDSLARGMRGLCTRLAMQLNKAFGRKGKLFAHRYHARALSTPLEVRRGLAYVLLNARKHAARVGKRMAASWIDPRSTAAAFAGWRVPPQTGFANHDFGRSTARTWLLNVGWRRHGLLAIDEVPVRAA